MSRQINSSFAAFVSLGLIVAMSMPASAQRGGRGFGRLFGSAKVDLATLPEVQTELKMTDEQQTKTTEIQDQLGDDRRNLFGSGFGRFSETRGEMDRLNREASDKVNELLDDSQRTRLQEIFIQQNGPMALNDDGVVEQLDLTEEQKTRLAEVRGENSQAVEDAFSDFGDLSREQRREKFRELGEAANEKLLGVLTEQQQEKLDQMKGEPFEIDWSQFRGRGGFRGRNNN